MATADLVLGILFLLLLVISILVGFTYFDIQLAKKAIQSHTRFQNTYGRLESLAKDLESEASNWPIYTRPVLFTSVDKNAQKSFGIAQQALMEAQEIAEKLPFPPARPDGTLDAISPFKCAERILVCEEIIQMEADFRKWLVQLEGGKKSLVQHHKEEDLTVEGVREKSAKLIKRLSEAEEKITAKTHGEKFNETIGWVINYAQIGTQAIKAKISARNEKGLLNFAIADTFIKLTNYLLEHFDLTEIDVSSDKFILDHFGSSLQDFEISLKQVIEAKAEDKNEKVPEGEISLDHEITHSLPQENKTRFAVQTPQKYQQKYYQQATNAIETWDDVALLNSLLGDLKDKLEIVRSSYSSFLRTQDVYFDLVREIKKPDLHQLLVDSNNLESECEKYWGELGKSPLHWKEALGDSKLPSTEFDIAKDIFLTNILHHIKTDAKIKQSEMTTIISQMTNFLKKVEDGNTSYKKLDTHLESHKNAKIEVDSRLKISGTTGSLVKKMEEYKDDYSTDNHQICIQNRKDYDNLNARARKVTGANFPAMLGEINALDEKCQTLITTHKDNIKTLHQLCETSSKALRTQRDNIKQYKDAAPKINYDFSSIEEKIASILQKDYINNKNYKSLQDHLNDISEIGDEAIQVLDYLNDQWNGFVIAEQKAYELIKENQANLDRYQNIFSESWAWVQEESTKIIEDAKGKNERFSLPLLNNRDHQFNATVENAIQNCQEVKEEIENLNTTALTKLDEIDQQQNDNLEIFNALMDMVDKPIPPVYYIFKIKPRVPEKLKELCSLATQVHDRRQVKSLLNAADLYFQKQLTEEEAEQLIINFGTVIGEQNNQPGSSVNNAGRDINF